MSKDIKEVIDIFGDTHILVSELSRGGQGVVYRTNISDIAVKLELDNMEFVERKKNDNKFENLRILPIEESTNITLPLTVLKHYSGYTMKLLEEMSSFKKIFDSLDSDYTNEWLEGLKTDFKEMFEIYSSYIKSGGKRRRLVSYLKLAENLLKLHNNGLVYCDLSTNNIFISTDSKYNNVWLIDADNLNFQTLVKGYYTPGFAAPEVIKGKGCTFYSDSYSFAICFFSQLLGTHPFRGALLENNGFEDEDDIEEKFYNGELPFIKNEEDNSNSSETNIYYEYIISEDLKNAFCNIFSEDSKENRSKRNTMHEWTYLLAKELDNDVKCSKCEMSYVNSDIKKCPWCDNINNIFRLKTFDKNNNIIWEIKKEVNKDYIDIPLRLVEDYDLLNTNDTLFKIKYDKRYLHINYLNNNYEFLVSNNKLMGENIYEKRELNIECISKKNNNTIIIKLEIL